MGGNNERSDYYSKKPFVLRAIFLNFNDMKAIKVSY